MKAIYRPRGAALEYAPLACNLYRGCIHGCRYCYVPACLHVRPEEFHAMAIPRSGILDALAIEAHALRRTDDPVLLCFTCDPYQQGDTETTRQALTILSAYDVPAHVLTKGGMRAVRDFDLLAQMRAGFGTTLLFTDDADRAEWEPHAAPVADRIAAIEQAHAAGIPTWVSVEPVIDPPQAIGVMEALAPWVDEWRVGKLNHHPLARGIDWNHWAPRLLAAAQATGAAYLIKNALARYLPAGSELRRGELAFSRRHVQPSLL
jgi:DNA repair photolyase